MVDVSARKAIKLGDVVTCDGFVEGVPYRVQTHIHEDHMGDFCTSKGQQHIFMSEATRALLIADRKNHADLPYRATVHGIPMNKPTILGDGAAELVLLSSNHMLGAVQVQVTVPTGIGHLRFGYSGDFRWPLPQVIQVDYLVLDATYGNPDAHRRFTQEDVDEQFIDLAYEKLREGPIVIQGYPGTVERAVGLLSEFRYPVLAGKRNTSRLGVYKDYGRLTVDAYSIESDEGRAIYADGRFIFVANHGEEIPECNGTIISLSAFSNQPDSIVRELSRGAYQVTMTNHADFEGTMEYVKATGASFVVTDSTRSNYAGRLAYEIRRQLGIEARASQPNKTLAWGA